MPHCVCDPLVKHGHKYVHWIGWYFHECVWTWTDQASFFIGMLSLLIWMFATFPQVYKNYKRKQADSMSFGLTGDICNLIGCILTNQLPTQTYTAVYYCSMDVVLMAQWIYYTRMHRKRAEYVEVPSPPSSVVSPTTASTLLLTAFVFLVGAPLLYDPLQPTQDHAAGRVLLSTPDKCELDVSSSVTVRVFGAIFSWCSGILYVGSRVPQVLQNHRKRGVEGLSVYLFVLAILGNVTYSLAILLRLPSMDGLFFEATLPYILGSAGTLVFDFIIIWQINAYGVKKAEDHVSPISPHPMLHPMEDQKLL